MFEQMRTRVANLRTEQDQASLRKAEAVIEYAVSSQGIDTRVLLLIEDRTPLKTSKKFMKKSSS